MYTAIDIANLIIYYYNDDYIHPLTRLRLQILLLYVQSKYLLKYNSKLFKEPIEKRRFGSEIKSIYHAFKGWGYSHINTPIYQYELTSKGFIIREFDLKNYDNRDIIFIKNILNKTREINTRHLISFIQEQDCWIIDKEIFLDVRNIVHYTHDDLMEIGLIDLLTESEIGI